MFYFFIDKNKYEVPESFKDVTLKQYKAASKVNESIKEDLTEQESIKHYIRFISEFLSIPQDKLKRVRITSDEGFGIIELYNYLIKFLEIPEYKEPLIHFNLNGVKYKAFTENLGVLHQDKLPEDMTFQEFEDMTSVMNNFDALKDKDADALSYLAAIVYRPVRSKGKWFWKKEYPEPYHETNVELRAKAFESLTMDIVFNAYFFLIKRTNILAQSLKRYSKVDLT